MKKPSALSHLGEVMQLAFVPKDIDAALRYWTQTMGVGPFFHFDHLVLEKAQYRGEPASLDFSVWIAYWGDIQIELIQQHNQAPSIYRSWLDQGREGLHHVCIVVQDMAQARRQCADAGAVVMQEAWLAGGGEAIYVDAGEGLIELIELPAANREFFAMMQAQAREWDGSDPIRALG
jgi:catechol 2,3-dioxygenase-like lactoylglutathione lyase family enzyme